MLAIFDPIELAERTIPSVGYSMLPEVSMTKVTSDLLEFFAEVEEPLSVRSSVYVPFPLGFSSLAATGRTSAAACSSAVDPRQVEDPRGKSPSHAEGGSRRDEDSDPASPCSHACRFPQMRKPRSFRTITEYHSEHLALRTHQAQRTLRPPGFRLRHC